MHFPSMVAHKCHDSNVPEKMALYGELNPADKEIRTLHLQPGHFDAPIVCTLTVVSLRHKPYYEVQYNPKK